MNQVAYLSIESHLLCKYNNSATNRKKQDSLKEYFEPAEFIKKDPVAWAKSVSPAYRTVLGINAYLESKYEHNFVSQETKANMCGLARETVNRIENYLHFVGVGRIKNCGYNSNEFKISNWFRKNNLAFGMNKLIPVFFCITTLLPAVNVTREYYKDYIYKNINTKIATNALERNHSKVQSLGNLISRTLSNIEEEKNTLKGEIAMQSSSKPALNSITNLPNYRREMIAKIAKAMRCREEDISTYDNETLEYIINNNPVLKEHKEKRI